MDWSKLDVTCALNRAENTLVQVLLSRFNLHRSGNGLLLDVVLEPEAPTIRRREGKAAVREAMPDFATKAKAYQAQLDAVCFGDAPGLTFHDDSFVFRYASGGVLPIVKLDKTDYYCLFYRDAFPVGWNIANGGCDSLAELLHPGLTALRELQEELLICDFTKGVEYYYRHPDWRSLDLVEFQTAKALWEHRFAERQLARLARQPAELRWLPCPDTLTVRYAGNAAVTTTNCIVNINAFDFGIEIDRIAELTVPEQVRFLDGELLDNHLLGQPIGLFAVDKLQRAQGGQELRPDRLFYDGNPRPAEQLEATVEEYWDELIRRSLRQEDARARWRNRELTPFPYALCPVTRSLVRRDGQRRVSGMGGPGACGCDVLISYAGEDKAQAVKIKLALEERQIKCWFDEERIGDSDRVPARVEEALSTCKWMLACVSRHYLESTWCQAERRGFSCDPYSGEPDTGRLFVLMLEDGVRLPALLAGIRRSQRSNAGEYRRFLDRIAKVMLAER